MTNHLGYLRYVISHKWYVFIECCKLGIPFRGIVHDLSKFYPSEWFGYANFFYGNKEKQNQRQFDLASEHGGIHEMIPYGMLPKDQFRVAWNHHQHRNPHHWQYWLHRKDDGTTFSLPMPKKYLKEMLADWRAMGRKFDGVYDWYIKNRDAIQLCDEDRAWVEKQLGMSMKGGVAWR